MKSEESLGVKLNLDELETIEEIKLLLEDIIKENPNIKTSIDEYKSKARKKARKKEV